MGVNAIYLSKIKNLLIIFVHPFYKKSHCAFLVILYYKLSTDYSTTIFSKGKGKELQDF
jgi:hypothetical protein